MNSPEQTRSPLRVLVIGAHPDDCEIGSGGLTTKYRKRGDVVKYVSATNGNAGHHKMGGGPLALHRLEETRRVSAVADIEYEVLDNDDGKLQADLPTREQFIRVIRQFRPDLLFTHRINDYHPDHRHTGMLVQDASYLIRVPNICPTVPHLNHAPVILYLRDGFQKPNPFTPDVVVSIDEVAEEKAQMLHCHASQFYEWLPYVGNYDAPENESDRLPWLRERFAKRDTVSDGPLRDALVKRYGPGAGRAVQRAEAFEISEYGASLPQSETDRYFPR